MFTVVSASERILKIGELLGKVWAQYSVLLFLLLFFVTRGVQVLKVRDFMIVKNADDLKIVAYTHGTCANVQKSAQRDTNTARWL